MSMKHFPAAKRAKMRCFILLCAFLMLIGLIVVVISVIIVNLSHNNAMDAANIKPHDEEDTISDHLLNNFKSPYRNGTYKFTLVDEWRGSNFFDGFEFWSDPDPSNGFVRYFDKTKAQSKRLIKTSLTNAYIYADSSNFAHKGRKSVRIQSKKLYDRGLVVLSLNHMPEGCGTWPAFWSYGRHGEWPKSGEIDIIEGVHTQIVNQVALHTTDGCDMHPIAHELKFSGTWETGTSRNPAMNCHVGAAHQYPNQGCSQSMGNEHSFGSNFNRNGGGYFVMLWDPKVNNLINIWYFNHTNVPSDLKLESTQPSSDPVGTWGPPNAQFHFGSNCHVKRLKKHNIVMNTNFCGDWAGNVWQYFKTCNVLAKTCEEFVANNPQAFENAYWDINFLRVFDF